MLRRNSFLAVAAVLILSILIIASISTVSAQGPMHQQTPVPGNGPMMGGQGGMMGMMGGQMSPEQCAQMTQMMGGMMMGGQAGMMGGMMMGMMERMGADHFGPGTGMMGEWTPPADLLPADKPLTLESAAKIGEAYVDAWTSERKLKLGEVMQFANNFYGQALEVESGRGAFEFLIDPQTGTVYAEPGPNMMWNLRYGMGGGGMGMWRPSQTADLGEKLTITPAQAREYAQAYLDKALPGAKLHEDLTTFYGYYTMDFSQNDKTAGMLSVNGFTGQVWFHHWHGDFVGETK